MEYLHEAMNLPDSDAFCVHCSEPASSSHMLNDCILANLTQKVVTEYCKSKGYTNQILSDETYLSFFWWEPKILDYNQREAIT